MNYGRISQRDRGAIIANRMRQWRDLAWGGINRHDRALGRRRLALLIARHPEVAEAHGIQKVYADRLKAA